MKKNRSSCQEVWRGLMVEVLFKEILAIQRKVRIFVGSLLTSLSENIRHFSPNRGAFFVPERRNRTGEVDLKSCQRFFYCRFLLSIYSVPDNLFYYFADCNKFITFVP